MWCEANFNMSLARIRLKGSIAIYYWCHLFFMLSLANGIGVLQLWKFFEGKSLCVIPDNTNTVYIINLKYKKVTVFQKIIKYFD